MEKIIRLAKELEQAAKLGKIKKCIKLSKKIAKTMKTYTYAC